MTQPIILFAQARNTPHISLTHIINNLVCSARLASSLHLLLQKIQGLTLITCKIKVMIITFPLLIISILLVMIAHVQLRHFLPCLCLNKEPHESKIFHPPLQAPLTLNLYLLLLLPIFPPILLLSSTMDLSPIPLQIFLSQTYQEQTSFWLEWGLQVLALIINHQVNGQSHSLIIQDAHFIAQIISPGIRNIVENLLMHPWFIPPSYFQNPCLSLTPFLYPCNVLVSLSVINHSSPSSLPLFPSPQSTVIQLPNFPPYLLPPIQRSPLALILDEEVDLLTLNPLDKDLDLYQYWNSTALR